MSERQNLIAIEGIKARMKLELDNLKAAIKDWKIEEILWKEREAELLADSRRLDKLERAMRAGHSIDAYGWDDEKNEWGKAGIGVLFKDSDGDRWSGADLLADNVRDVIDELEEQDHG